MTECIQESFEFQGLNNRKVIGKYDGGTITSDGGGLLLREVETKTNIIKQFSECFTDYRNKDYTEHNLEELLRQRVYGLALGYEDLNDHDGLRRDPVMAVISGKKDPTGADRKKAQDKGKALAGKSTLNRLELSNDDEKAKNHRYKKITHKQEAIKSLFVDIFLQSRKHEPNSVIIDLDTTDDIIHGTQEGRHYHGYYGNYCYLPLYVFCGQDLLCAKLNTSDKGGGMDAAVEVKRIIDQIRKKWPHTHIIIRGDGDFSKDDLMSMIEGEEGCDYIFGLSKNARLIKEIQDEMDEAKRLCIETGEKQRLFKGFTYETLKTWTRKRRVIGKAEQLKDKANPRFIVTSLSQEEYPDCKKLYEDIYCARGDMENRIKEQQLDLFSDRTSTHELKANQLRLWFSSIAYVLMAALRRYAQGTELANAQCQTLRLKLLKIGAQMHITTRRIVLSFANGYPLQKIFKEIFVRLSGPPLYQMA